LQGRWQPTVVDDDDDGGGLGDWRRRVVGDGGVERQMAEGQRVGSAATSCRAGLKGSERVLLRLCGDQWKAHLPCRGIVESGRPTLRETPYLPCA
jgi:hypothetical protein